LFEFFNILKYNKKDMDKPKYSEENITFFAETNFRNQRVKFGIKLDDRRKHMYVIGKTGMGKTVMLSNMAISDIENGFGLAFIDPHGESAEHLLDFVPEKRLKDVIYFCPHDTEYPIAFNPLESVGEEQRNLVASGILEIFKKIWPDVWSARMEYILNNCLMALLEYPNSTLLGIMRLLTDKDYRDRIVSGLKDPVVKSFWVNEFARYHDKFQVEAIAPIQNKVGQFLTNPLVRNIVGQPKSSFNIRQIMDEGKILIVNLSKGRIGEVNSALLGAMLVTKIQQAALSRADIPESERRDFMLYVDEFQTFATEAFATILSEARKYHLCLIISHQYIGQLPESVKAAIFGNVGTFVVFRVGAEDAEWLEKEFAPEFMANDLVNLAKYNIYLKLMIDGITSKAFSAVTLPPRPKPEISFRHQIIKNTREFYCRPRIEVEKQISEEWLETEEEKEVEKPAKSAKKESKKETYEDFCWVCGAKVEVPFQPDGKRPVYCKDCLKGVEAGEIIPPTKPLHLETKIVKTLAKSAEKKLIEKKESVKPKAQVDVNELKKALRESLSKLSEAPKEKTEEKENNN
jgi:CxxC-x17-CxxC domain-containing protein